jgi:hypothetical protein
LHSAARAGHHRVLVYLLTRLPPAFVFAKTLDGATCFHFAACPSSFPSFPLMEDSFRRRSRRCVPPIVPLLLSTTSASRACPTRLERQHRATSRGTQQSPPSRQTPCKTLELHRPTNKHENRQGMDWETRDRISHRDII